MAATVLVRGGARIWLIDPSRPAAEGLPTGPTPDEAAVIPGPSPSPEILAGISQRLRSRLSPGGVTVVYDASLRTALASAGVPVRAPTLAELRAAFRKVPEPTLPDERRFLLAVARSRLAGRLAAPVETLVALAREEERLEGALRREHGAAEQFLVGPSGSLAEYAAEWTAARRELERHHERLVARLERAAVATLPNLSRLVGPRVAARLLARAGDLATLGRSTGSRLQILGSRRRPGAERGPRYGVLYRAARMSDVPIDRQGRYARSLAALAAIAARTDASTRRDLGDLLVRRRDRRVDLLRRTS